MSILQSTYLTITFFRTPLPSSSLTIRVNRTPRSAAATPVTPFGSSRLAATPATAKNMETFGAQQRSAPLEPERRITLTSLVSDYLSNKHALCKNPMTTCPEFDLFLPHRCPDKRSKRAAPLNICARMMRRSVFPRHGGLDGAKLDRKLLYSRFRPVKSFRAGGEDRENNVCFTCTAFSGDGQFLLAGTGMGDLKMFNIQSGTQFLLQFVEKVSFSLPQKASRGAPG